MLYFLWPLPLLGLKAVDRMPSFSELACAAVANCVDSVMHK